MNMLQAVTSAFDDWLAARTGAATNSRVRLGARLDPYGTSMRVTKQVSADLQNLRAGAPLTVGDVTQRAADLGTAGLVKKTGAHTYITAFGRAVLERWEQLEVADDVSEHELVRNVVLADEGLRRGVALYTRARVFWAELTELRAAEEWFGNPFALYMASYLNWDDEATGYNPWRVLRAVKADPLMPDLAGWNEWAKHTVKPAGWTRTRGEKFVSTVEGYATRYAGRVSFCMGLEARRRALLGEDLSTSISQWKVPVA